MAKNRPQRPGEQPVTEAPARGGSKNRNKPRHKNRNRGGGGGGGNGPAAKPSAPVALPQAPPGSIFDRNADYGYDGEKPYYQTDVGRIDATDNPEKLYAFLDAMAGFSGNASPFAIWRQTQGQQQFLNALNNAQRVNPDLNPVDFASGLGGNVSGPSTTQPVPMGTGQPVDTGNPFTSSSGVGGGTVGTQLPMKPNRPTPLSGPLGRAMGRLGTQLPMKPRPPLGGVTPHKPTTPNQPPLDWNLRQRFDFLKLSPEQRGESVGGAINTPGRWSPWG